MREWHTRKKITFAHGNKRVMETTDLPSPPQALFGVMVTSLHLSVLLL